MVGKNKGGKTQTKICIYNSFAFVFPVFSSSFLSFQLSLVWFFHFFVFFTLRHISTLFCYVHKEKQQQMANGVQQKVQQKENSRAKIKRRNKQKMPIGCGRHTARKGGVLVRISLFADLSLKIQMDVKTKYFNQFYNGLVFVDIIKS